MKFLIDIPAHQQAKDARLFLILLIYRAMLQLPEPEDELNRIDTALKLFWMKRQIAYKSISPPLSQSDYKELEAMLKKRLILTGQLFGGSDKEYIVTKYAIKQRMHDLKNVSVPLYDKDYLSDLLNRIIKLKDSILQFPTTEEDKIKKQIECFYMRDDCETRTFYIENMDENKNLKLTKGQSDKIVSEKSQRFQIIINLKKNLINLYCYEVFGQSNMSTADIYKGLMLLEKCQNIDTIKKADIICDLLAETEAKEQFRDFWSKRKDILP